jgi:hypothetical protein
MDDYGSAAELLAARAKDTALRWQDVPLEHVSECPNALSYFDPESWRFYIPLYILWVLKHFRTTSDFLVDSTVYSLQLHPNEPLQSYQLARFKVLSKAQSRAICEFLRYMARQTRHADAGAAHDALEYYWSPFCPNGA